MNYINLFDPIHWDAVVYSIIQTAIIFVLVLIGLKIVGRRVFGERSPQDLIILLLVAEACDLGLTDQNAGFWGSIASVIIVLILGAATERIGWLRDILEDKPVVLFKDGRINHKAMQKCLVNENDLEETAREYGIDSYRKFSQMTLESDGTISGVLQGSMNRRTNKRPT